MLSIIASDSITLEPNQEPFRLTLNYNGAPHDYWLLRGDIQPNYGTVSDSDFIYLRGLYDEGTLPGDWAAIIGMLDSRAQADGMDLGQSDN